MLWSCHEKVRCGGAWCLGYEWVTIAYHKGPKSWKIRFLVCIFPPLFLNFQMHPGIGQNKGDWDCKCGLTNIWKTYLCIRWYFYNFTQLLLQHICWWSHITLNQLVLRHTMEWEHTNIYFQNITIVLCMHLHFSCISCLEWINKIC